MSEQDPPPYEAGSPARDAAAAAPPAEAQPYAQAVRQAAAGQIIEAQQAWVEGYEPGNPWQATLRMRTPQGTVSFPLTPHTIPDLLEPMVLVTQEQQGLTAGLDHAEEADTGEPAAAEGTVARSGRPKPGAASRLSGWAVVHDLWEREDPSARIVMGAVVVVLIVLGVFLS